MQQIYRKQDIFQGLALPAGQRTRIQKGGHVLLFARRLVTLVTLHRVEDLGMYMCR